MKDGATYPEYIGVSDVTTRSAEQLNFDLYFDTKESTGRLRGLAREGRARPLFEERFQIGSAGTPEEALIEAAKKQAKRKK